MKHTDVDLIQQTLAGDETAFAELVKKYQKPVHTLAWRKIGDFQIAEEITQDTFLKVYQRLHTLKNPNQFLGWLYVIATRRCYAWLRKKRIRTDPLEDVETIMIPKDAYSEHVIEDRKHSAVDAHREAVKKLLAKLKESERTVMTLHYLGEMTVEEISKFIGVSSGTIKSRLQRARNRLQKEETMIREALEHFQISPNMTDNIMQEVSRLKPTPSSSKPFIPWTVAATTAVLIALMLGIGNQHLARFQEPYSLEAQSEMSVEITEAQLAIETPAKPLLRAQIGKSDISDENSSHGQNSEVTSATVKQNDNTDTTISTQEWIQTEGLAGGAVPTLFSTTRGDMYAGTLNALYRLTDDGRRWKRIKTRSSPSLRTENKEIGWGIMVERDDTLYLATDTEVLATTDRGDTWKRLGTHPGGLPIGFVITDHAFYLGLPKKLYFSEDNGVSWKSWTLSKDEQTGINIRTMTSLHNTVFVGTDKGVYRLIDNIWKRISIGPGLIHEKGIDIHAIAVAEDQLYVVKIVPAKRKEITQVKIPQGITKTPVNFGWRLYHSKNKGDSWNLIAYKDNIYNRNASYFPLKIFGPRRQQFPFTFMSPNFKVKIAVQKGRVVVLDTAYQSYSIDTNGNWQLDETNYIGPIHEMTPTPVMLNPNTIYSSNLYGIQRTTDGGKSWREFNSGITGTTILDLFFLHDTLYAMTHRGIIASTDGGKSWTDVFLYGGDISVVLKKFQGELYARTDRIIPIFADTVENKGMDVGGEIGEVNILHFLKENDRTTLNRVPPTFQPSNIPNIDMLLRSFAVSNSTFYAENDNKLFRWKPGTTEWLEIGLTDEGSGKEGTNYIAKGFKLGVTGNIVYVGKPDGTLLVSYDEGKIWNDLTPTLPFAINTFNEIVLVGYTVYIATDAGVITSKNGKNWRGISDADGTNLVMGRLVLDGNTLYAVSKDTGIYHLKNGIWEQIVSEIPDNVNSLAAAGKTLYVGTETQGMLHYTLE